MSNDETKEPRTMRVVIGTPIPYKGEVLLPGVEYTLPYAIGAALVQQNQASLPVKGRYARRDVRSVQ
jgi:hypothetical protein